MLTVDKNFEVLSAECWGVEYHIFFYISAWINPITKFDNLS